MLAGGFSQLAFQAGLPLLAEKTRANGIAALAINRCVHFSALWVEIEQLTAAGLVALACNPSHAWVAPAGGRAAGVRYQSHRVWLAACGARIRLCSTSPPVRLPVAISNCIGVPANRSPKVGASMPRGNRAPTPTWCSIAGAMLTFGGHKGSALAAMVELIAGPLIGDLTSAESLAYDAGSKSSPYHGELIIAFDPRRFLGEATEQHLARAEALFQNIQGQGARLPSQRRYEARLRSLDGRACKFPRPCTTT